MRGRRGLALLAVLAVGAGGAAVAQTMEPVYLSTRDTECWRCHNVPVGGAPPVEQFGAIVPPALVEATPGEPFDYTVQVHNAWSGALTYLEPGLDLTGAPALGFVSDVPPMVLSFDDAIRVAPTQPTANQSKDVPVVVTEGLTHLRILLSPQDTSPVTGPDLTLRVKAGAREFVRDDGGRGVPEELVFDGRDAFAGLGYGEWTVTAQVTPVPLSTARPAEALNATLAAGDLPFHLVLEGEARDLPDRVLRMPIRLSVVPAQPVAATFRLVASEVPATPQGAEALLQGHVHYTHTPQAQAPDDADFLSPNVPVHVAAAATPGRLAIASSALPAPPPLVQNGATMATVAETVGYTSGFLLLSSTWAGGLFGKASRRQLNGVFGSAKRRVAFHNFVSYGLIMAALTHTVLFLVEASYGWTVGLLWGGLAVLAMLGLGLTGALQVPMIRKWSFGSWRWSHFALALGAMLFTVAHVALDGVHFSEVQDALGWRDPLVHLTD